MEGTKQLDNGLVDVRDEGAEESENEGGHHSEEVRLRFRLLGRAFGGGFSLAGRPLLPDVVHLLLNV